MAEVQIPKKQEGAPIERPKLQKIQGAVVRKTLGQRMKETFISPEVTNVKPYIKKAATDAFKNTLADILINTVNLTLGTNIKRPGTGNSIRNGVGTFVQTTYSGYFNAQQAAQQQKNARPVFEQNNVPTDWNSIIVEQLEGESDSDCKKRAESVIIQLCDMIDVYDRASVMDLYEIVGIEAKHTDYNYGWNNLTQTNVVKVNGGYWLKFPKPSPLPR